MSRREPDRYYVSPLGPGAQYFIKLWRKKKTVEWYRVQLEVEVDGKWHCVIGYDPKHGGPHIDVYHPEGDEKDLEHRYSFDIVKGYTDALESAIREIKRNWQDYQRNFLEGRWPR